MDVMDALRAHSFSVKPAKSTALEDYAHALASVPRTGDALTVSAFAMDATHVVSNPPSHAAYMGEVSRRGAPSGADAAQGASDAHGTSDADDAADGVSDADDASDADADALAPTAAELHAARAGTAALPREKQLTPQQFFNKFVAVTSAQALAIRRCAQGSDAWLKAREPRTTASAFGAAAGESPYETVAQFIVKKLWNGFKGNADTAYGQKHERDGLEAFVTWFHAALAREYAAAGKVVPEDAAVIWTEGLIVRSDVPHVAASPDFMLRYVTPDGVVHYANGEIKSPSSKRDSVEHPYNNWPLNLPSPYKAQVQGVAHLLNTAPALPELDGLPTSADPITEAWFVVWQPRHSRISRLSIDAAYGERLFAALDASYVQLLVALTHQYNGVLIPGTLDVCTNLAEADAADLAFVVPSGVAAPSAALDVRDVSVDMVALLRSGADSVKKRRMT